MVYADTGEEQSEVSPEMLDRIAAAWAQQPAGAARKESVEEPDQWTIAGQLRNLRPMYKDSWPDGQQVYLNGNTGEVVQYTTLQCMSIAASSLLESGAVALATIVQLFAGHYTSIFTD
jgi:hypothetical protein